MPEITKKMFDLSHYPQAQQEDAGHTTPPVAGKQTQTLMTISSAHLLEPAANLRLYGIRAIYDEYGALVEVPKRNPEGLAHWLRVIFDRARADSACVVSFDRNAALVSDLPRRGRITARGWSTIPRMQAAAR